MDVVALDSSYYQGSAVPSAVTNVIAVSAGNGHAIALRKDGKVVAWGENQYGQCSVPAHVTNAVGVTAGYNYSVAIGADGTVACWGLSMQRETNVPVGLAGVVAVSARASHTLALLSNRTVVAWGDDSLAQCSVPFGLSDVVAVSAGNSHSLALKADGTVVAWGSNRDGQASVPANLSNVVVIAAALDHSVALKVDGTVVAWGNTNYGQTAVPAALRDVVAINAGDSQTFVLRTDGTLASWGYTTDLIPSDLPRVTGLASTRNFVILGQANPRFTVEPWDRYVVVGSSVSLAAKVVGARPISYQWQLNGAPIPGATQDSISFANAGVGDSGVYTLVVSNELAITTSRPATLEVSPSQNHAPMLREQPDRTINAVTHLEVSNAAMDADVPANLMSYRLIEAPPNAEIDAAGVIHWSPSPEEVPSQVVFTTIVTDDGLPPLSSTNSFKVLVLDWAQSGSVGIVAGPILYPENRHQYFLLNEASWTDAEATAVAMGGHLVTVNDQEEHIWLRRTFSSYDDIDRALWIGLIDPDPSITWSPDHNAWVQHFIWASGQPITFFCWSTSGQFSQGAGRIKMCQPDPLWPWGQAEWAEEAAWVRLNGVVEVPLSLQIVTQPQSTSVGIGRNATLQVVADSTAPITYQWQFMGTNLSGETKSSLTISNALPAHSGSYCVVLSNACGTITSDTAVLSVAGIVGWGISAFGVCDVPTSAMNIVAIASGSLHSLALKDDGTVVAWGDNRLGQIDVPIGLRDVSRIAAGGYTSLALKADGVVVGWGSNEQGELNIPSDLTNVMEIAVAGGQCLALKADGTVVAWGSQTEVPVGLTNVVAIATGGSHSMVLRSDGTVATWGNYVWTSNDGWIQAYVPAGLSNVVAIAAGATHSLALRADGTVAAWGFGSEVETNVPPGLTNVVAISAGMEHSLVLKADGTVVEWGIILGDVSQPKDLPNVVAIAAGNYFNLALLQDGAPHLTVQPRDQVVALGSSPSFSAKAIGVQSIQFQWRLNENDIPGATQDTYTVQNAQPTNAGLYTLVVSNPLGMLTSRRAKLAVSAPLPTTNQPPVLTVNAGQTVTFTNSATGGAPGRRFTFNLSSASIGGTINTDTGVFTWRPPVMAAGTTNLIEVLVTDDSTPPTTSIQTFAIVVDPLQPVLLTPVSISDGLFRLRVSGTVGPDYIFEATADLIDWRNLQTSSPASMPFDFADTNANFSTNRFYRVRLSP